MADNNDDVTEINTSGAGPDEQGLPPGFDMSAVTANLMNDPNLMAALAGQLEGMVGARSGLQFSPKTKRRVLALKKLQSEHVKLQVQFQNEVALLEQKYTGLYKPLYEKRKAVVTGDHTPTEDELFHESEDEDEEEKPAEEEPAADEETDEPDNLSHFWLHCLMAHPATASLVQEHDEEALEHLTDITLEYLEGPNSGFKLNFHFSPNEFFSDAVLTKTYHLSPEPEEADQLMYQGPVFQRATGTTINWKADKNLTQKTVKKKQRKKGGRNAGETRTITRSVPQQSFFNFFNPPDMVDSNEEREEVIEACMEMLHQDYDVGDIIANKLIPNAVLFFTGEIWDYESDGEEEEEEDMEGDDLDDDDDDDNDADYQPPAAGEQPPECKQS